MIQRLVAQCRELDASHRKNMRRKAAAERKVAGGHPAHGRPQDIDDLVTFEDRNWAGRVRPGRQLMHGIVYQVAEVHRWDVGVTEVQNPRSEREVPAVILRVAKLNQRVEKAPGRGPGYSRPRCDLAQGLPLPFAPEGANDVQSSRERVDIHFVLAAAARFHGRGRGRRCRRDARRYSSTPLVNVDACVGWG